jgi:ubiquinone/menaquinone biosynthesis C-methylase UbiE/uncharacterized protein YbaR (Trm112 family)
MLDGLLEEKIVCPDCRGKIRLEEECLICLSCGRKYPLRSGIPDFLDPQEEKALSWKSADPLSYERDLESMPSWRLQRIDRPLIDSASGDVLEIGCGTCRLAAQIEGKKANFFGLDPMPEYLVFAKQKRGQKKLVRAKGEKLPFAGASFDTVVSGFYAFRYIDPAVGLPEARRVLKKGGRFTLEMLNHWLLNMIEYKSRIKYGAKPENTFPRGVSGREAGRHYDFKNFSELRRLAENSGFRIEKIYSCPVSPVFPYLNRYLSGCYLRGKMIVYLGLDVIIELRAV